MLPQPVSPTISVTRFSWIFSMILLRSDCIGNPLKSDDAGENDEHDDAVDHAIVQTPSFSQKFSSLSSKLFLCFPSSL